MKKGFAFLILTVLIAVIIFSSLDSNAEYICGDANNDGSLDISDAILIINFAFGGGPAPEPGCCVDCPPTVTDYDGNVYQTVLIGDQCWMAENLKVTHYRNGDPIPYVANGSEWSGLSSGAYGESFGNPVNVATYGRLYNYYAVDDSRNIAPEGWHVPTDAELKQLEMYLGMSSAEADAEDWRGTDEGGKLKEAGTSHWYAPNTGATNESGFTALPGGFRSYIGYYNYLRTDAYFWSSTELSSCCARSRQLDNINSQIRRSDVDKHYGYSVRCVRD